MSGQRGKRIRILVGLILFSVLAGAIALLAKNRTPILMVGARPIADTRNWLTTGSQPFYHWLSNDLLLYIDHSNTERRWKKLRLSTGTIIDCSRIPNNLTEDADFIRVSPDNHYLVWGNRSQAYQCLLNIDNLSIPSRIIKLKRTVFYREPLWFPDSRGWFLWGESDSGPIAEIHTVRKPETEQTRPLSIAPATCVIQMLSNGDSISVWRITEPQEQKNTFGIRRVRSLPITPATPGTEETVTLPFTSSTWDWYPLAISPDGSLVLWREVREGNRWQAAWQQARQQARRFLPWLPALSWGDNPDGNRELVQWLSDPRGNNLRSLGEQGNSYLDGFSEIRWMPNGRNISFIHKGILYVRPVP